MDEFNENGNTNENTNNEEKFDAFENNQSNVNVEQRGPIIDESINENPMKEEPKKNSNKTIIIVVVVLLIVIPIIVFSVVFFGSLFLTIYNTAQDTISEAERNNGIISNNDVNKGNTDTDSVIEEIEYKTWELGPFKLKYDADNWEEQKFQGYDIIKYKDMENYVGYLGSIDFTSTDSFSSQDFRDGFEEQSRESLSATDVTYLYTDWSEIDGIQHLCKMHCTATNTDSGEEGYVTYCFYFLGGKMYTFMTTEEVLDANFEEEAEEILEGVIL